MTSTDRYTDALAELRDYHTAGGAGYRDPRVLAEAQVSATLALAGASALQAAVAAGANVSEEVSEWVRLLCPQSGARRRTHAEWLFVLLEDAEPVPYVDGPLTVAEGETFGFPCLDLDVRGEGVKLTSGTAEALALALLRWSYQQRGVQVRNPDTAQVAS